MDDVDKAQLILEGRCIECTALVPKHTTDCSRHPWRYVLGTLNKLKVQLIKKTEKNKSV
jgi:hypothetical protein